MWQFGNQHPAIVFDFGGVLIDWNPRYLYRKLFENDLDSMERFLTDIEFVEWNLQQDKGRPLALAVRELSEQFPQYADLIRAYDDRWEESIRGPIQPTVDILYLLKETGHALFGLSNWSAETFRRIRHKHDFLDWFDEILISGDVRLVKPDPRIYAVFLERIGRTAEECLFIDDSEANITVASELGFNTIRFETPRQLEGELYRFGLIEDKWEAPIAVNARENQ